eukprot:TRINITY_DN19947_c0_g1_i1.p1 TRINITY_DN19947_c0_g1~~TRINITY_DN19947_c0_g1_i1.p1  ORF type:complete len:414 (+),score=100.22 TRINITY_DN19947_c0_g1_i1:234-1475(+)
MDQCADDSQVTGSWLLRKEENAHEDDIHALMKVSDDMFLSGSKDNSIKLWNFQSDLKQDLEVVSSSTKTYSKWITCLGCSAGHWASGSRDGQLNIWTHGSFRQHHRIEVRKSSDLKTKSKDRNQNRINCIQFMEAQSTNVICLGLPGQAAFLTFETLSDVSTSFQTIHANDWLYCIKQLADSSQKYALVIGSSIEIRSFDPDLIRFKKGSVLWAEKSHAARKQRAHVSDIEMLCGGSKIGASCFDSKVRIFDLASEDIQTVTHQGRVWSIKRLSDSGQEFVTAADDGTFKIWDLRDKLHEAEFTSPRHDGRVSQLLIDDTFTTLVSASCPDVLRDDEIRASLNFWDLRMMSKLQKQVPLQEDDSVEESKPTQGTKSTSTPKVPSESEVPKKLSYAAALAKQKPAKLPDENHMR